MVFLNANKKISTGGKSPINNRIQNNVGWGCLRVNKLGVNHGQHTQNVNSGILSTFMHLIHGIIAIAPMIVACCIMRNPLKKWNIL